ncbi:hypothetical protein [Cupriavidus basilensis]|uniref:hypothetical protein n=1 Tax=Cupriavidus basilensis TaxID=68895 RepID=UPI000B135D8B|nr:hypothetical protein [Cupriavidus basilensis]
MQQHTLYAYVDGSDLDDDVVDIERELVEFVASQGWVLSRPVVVNQKSVAVGSRPGDLPDWGLGINLALLDPGRERREWFADIERVVARLAHLRLQFGRDFVIGIADNVTGSADDILYIESESPDLGRLREVIEA